VRARQIRRWVAVGTGVLLLGFAAAPSGDGTTAKPPDAPDKESQALQPLDRIRHLIKEGRYAEAETAARALLGEAEAKYGAESTEAADALDLLIAARLLGGKANDPESRSLVERTLELRQKTLGPDHPDMAQALANLGTLHYQTGDYAGARPYWEQALTIREKAFGPNHPDVARSLNNLAILLKVMGDYAGAQPLSERALEINKKAYGPDHPEVATNLTNLANLLSEMGDYAGARPLYERALEIREKALGPHHLDVARTLNNLAVLLADTGDYAGARPLYERTLAINEKVLGPDHPEVAASLNNLAVLLKRTGDYAGAKSLYERTLAIDKKALGPDHPYVAEDLGNLANLLSDMGDYAGTRPLYERALEIDEKVFGPEHASVAADLNNLANLLSRMGDYAGARPLYERALRIDEKALGPDHPDVASDLNNLAILLVDMGDHAGARPLHERALEIREKALGPDHPFVAESQMNLANLLRDSGEHAQARSLHERAAAIREKALGPDHPDVAWSLDNLAAVLRDAGEYAEARSLYERAVAIREKALGPDHPRLAEGLSYLARLLSRSGDTEAALDAALRAERIGREHLHLTVGVLAEREALRYASVRASGLDLALSLAVEGSHAGSVREVWDALIRSRALVLDEMATRHRAVGGADDPEVARLAEALASASRRLANLMVREPGQDIPEHHRRLLDEARQEREKAERDLAEKSRAFRQARARQRAGLAKVAGSLPAGSALVAFALYNRYDLSPEETGTQEGDPAAGLKTPSERKSRPLPSYLAFVLPPGGKEAAVVPLGPAPATDTLVSRWQEEARGALARSPDDAEAAYRAAGEALRREVWDPVAAHLEDVSRVFVVPDGAPNLVNLAALPVGETDYLIEKGPLVHYLSAERDLVPAEGRRPVGEGLLALGGPAYDETSLFADLARGKKGPQPGAGIAAPGPAPATRSTGPEASLPVTNPPLHPFRGERSSCGDFKSIRFGSLPASEQEVDDVVAVWRKARGQSALRLAGSAAGESAFKDKSPGRRVLHLATHGFFLDGQCPSALESSRGIGGLSPAHGPERPALDGENPLLLSGLALAGANHRAAANPEEDDGILTAEEIAAMDLSGVEWAVLSACDTGVGKVRAGEGVFGLRRAFQVAGAGTLIMSLWSVEDEATRQWMNALYKGRLSKDLDTAEAVREASLTVLRERREKNLGTHPFYWAGFVAAGDWR
jgi:tetratricopeptide (TPR) repeat protein